MRVGLTVELALVAALAVVSALVNIGQNDEVRYIVALFLAAAMGLHTGLSRLRVIKEVTPLSRPGRCMTPSLNRC